MTTHTTFIQLSDTHILPTPDALLHGTNPTANLRRVLDQIRAMQIEPAFVLVSGDLVNGGEAESYAQFNALRQEIAALGAPVLLNLGNHDQRVPFRQVVLGEADASDEEAPYYYCQTIGTVRIFMLDSKIPGEIHGALGERQLNWLAEQLQTPGPHAQANAQANGHVGGDLIVVHHPVVPRGVPRHNDYLLQDADQLHDVLAGKPILGILSGHSHVSTTAIFAGTLFATAPATSALLDPSICDGGRFLEGSGFNLCTVRDGRLLVNPIFLPGEQRELFRYYANDLEAHRAQAQKAAGT